MQRGFGGVEAKSTKHRKISGYFVADMHKSRQKKKKDLTI